MTTDISKACSDHLRSFVAASAGSPLKASHARELVAAFFGYKSHASLLAEKKYAISDLPLAQVLIPDLRLIEVRRKCLSDLPKTLPDSMSLASELSTHLVQQNHFAGKVWLHNSIENFVTKVLLREGDARLMHDLYGIQPEANTEIDHVIYKSAKVIEDDEMLTIEVSGRYTGHSYVGLSFYDGPTDMDIEVELYRVAGRAGYLDPVISASGEADDDWMYPALCSDDDVTQGR
jgi:hypothetical protein